MCWQLSDLMFSCNLWSKLPRKDLDKVSFLYNCRYSRFLIECAGVLLLDLVGLGTIEDRLVRRMSTYQQHPLSAK